MLVHGMSTLQKLNKVVHANVDSNGQTNGRPKRVTTTNPVPELEHVFAIDSEFFNPFFVC